MSSSRQHARSSLGRLLGCLLPLIVLAALAWAGWRWVQAHPQHNPLAPLALDQPVGMATPRKLQALVDDAAQCRAIMVAHGLKVDPLPPAGADACYTDDRLRIGGPLARDVAVRPATPVMRCAVAAGSALWLEQGVQAAAMTHLGQRVVRVEHLGTVNCRRIGGGRATTGGGRWSEHATGNAIDIAAFVLADGRRVSVLDHWAAPDGRSAFLRAARDAACDVFATTLSPDYNAAHADHLHLDLAGRGGATYCR